MFEGLATRVERLAHRAAARRLDRVEAELRGDLPADVRVKRIEGGLQLSGRGLRRRIVTDPRLRWPGRRG